MSILKRMVASLSPGIRFEVESLWRAWQLRMGRFSPEEPEYDVLPELVHSGDCVLDVGANIGHYTVELSRLVGPSGRVISLEPTPAAFAQLAGAVARLGLNNVSLLNAAASDTSAVRGMVIPRTTDGLPSFYQASIRDDQGALQVISVRLDDLPIAQPVALAKIDVEGHEIAVLDGMRSILERCRPILIVEDSSPELFRMVEPLGYREEKLVGSPNRLFWPSERALGLPDGTREASG